MNNKRKNIIRNTTEMALHIVASYVMKGDTVIDATLGNGYDTAALCRMTGDSGHVIGIDIQAEALESSKKLLESEGLSAELVLDNHKNLAKHAQPESVAAILFNLGYLPGGNKEFTTHTESTITALNAALDLIIPDGVICVVMYSGHEEGLKEKQKILSWAAVLDKKIYHCAYIAMINQPSSPPEILLISRKK